MTDVHSKETRSFNKCQIKGKNTKPGMGVRNFFLPVKPLCISLLILKTPDFALTGD
jgi:G:T-mismatch repair DNA endonuclease (very short patch repair protein)